MGPVPDALDPPADSGYNGGGQTHLTIDDYNRAAEIAGQGKDTVTYYRVQTRNAASGKTSRECIIVNADGTIKIDFPDVGVKGNLNVSAYTTEHAEYYIENARSDTDSYIVAFEIPKELDAFIRQEAIPQYGYKSNPLKQGGSAPKLTDVTTPGYTYELPPVWLDLLEEYASNARILEWR